MNKLQFESLDFASQLNYVNENLQKLGSVTAVSKSLGYKGSADISKLFNAKNYRFNGTTKSYEPMGSQVIEEVTMEGTNYVKLTEAQMKELNEFIQYKDILIEMAKERIKNKPRLLDFTLLQDLPKTDDNVVRSINVSKTLMEDFDLLCKSYHMYSKKDLLMLAIAEFIEKYNTKEDSN